MIKPCLSYLIVKAVYASDGEFDDAQERVEKLLMPLEDRCSDQEHLLKDYDNMRRIVKWQGEMLKRAKDLMMFDTQDQQFIHEWMSDLEKGPKNE